MPHAFDRKVRVGDLIKHELAKLLLASKDPRFTFASITSVEVSNDYANAKVFVSLLDENMVDEVMPALNKAAGFFRFQLAKQVNLRTTPRLHFHYDNTLAQGQKINDLLKKSTKEDNKD